MQYQRAGKDMDPVKPWNWATMPLRAEPVEILSYPVPAEGDGLAIVESRATIMVRLTVGDPTTLKEVALQAIAAFSPDRHEDYYT